MAASAAIHCSRFGRKIFHRQGMFINRDVHSHHFTGSGLIPHKKRKHPPDPESQGDASNVSVICLSSVTRLAFTQLLHSYHTAITQLSHNYHTAVTWLSHFTQRCVQPALHLMLVIQNKSLHNICILFCFLEPRKMGAMFENDHFPIRNLIQESFTLVLAAYRIICSMEQQGRLTEGGKQRDQTFEQTPFFCEQCRMS